MDVGEKLVEQLREVASKTPPICRYDNPDEIEHFGKIITVYCKPFEQFQELMRDAADYIANSVTVQKSSCPYCCDNGEGHRMLKHSYDDEDGMEMSIHPSTRKENGYKSQAWWATVHFRGECRDFYIEVCPFCGRRLVPLKEERETAMPQPPKGE